MLSNDNLDRPLDNPGHSRLQLRRDLDGNDPRVNNLQVARPINRQPVVHHAPAPPRQDGPSYAATSNVPVDLPSVQSDIRTELHIGSIDGNDAHNTSSCAHLGLLREPYRAGKRGHDDGGEHQAVFLFLSLYYV